VWNYDGLSKVNIFCWTLIHEKISTTENLQKRGIQGRDNFKDGNLYQNVETLVNLISP
jgi:hypothetical protein